ncbi:MAG: hypothetical protein ACK4IT_02105 [Thioalkalivibrionaceae bacterium]
MPEEPDPEPEPEPILINDKRNNGILKYQACVSGFCMIQDHQKAVILIEDHG